MKQCPLGSQAESYDNGGYIEGVLDVEGDQEMAEAGEDQDQREHERAREFVLVQEGF